MQPPPAKRQKGMGQTEIVNFRPLLVKAYEYFELLELNKINGLVMNKHISTLNASSKRKTECLGDIRLA